MAASPHNGNAFLFTRCGPGPTGMLPLTWTRRPEISEMARGLSPDLAGEALMDAVILAAGLGTRLRPHTLTTPKPLLAVRGRPILDWALGALPAPVDRVLVVVH